MIEAIGWIASLMLGICGLPQAYQCFKQKHAKGVSKSFLLLWLGGEVLMQVYVISKHGFDMPLLSNYWLNTIFCLVIAKFMFFPNRSHEMTKCDFCEKPMKYYGSHHCYMVCEEHVKEGEEFERRMIEAKEESHD